MSEVALHLLLHATLAFLLVSTHIHVASLQHSRFSVEGGAWFGPTPPTLRFLSLGLRPRAPIAQPSVARTH